MSFKNNRKLLDGATATNSAPTKDTDGIPLSGGYSTAGVIAVKSSAGSGTMSCSLKLWGYVDALSAWVPFGTHATDASRGLLNGASSIGEVNSDSIEFAERIEGISHFDRVYLEITAIGGTSTALDAWLIIKKR